MAEPKHEFLSPKHRWQMALPMCRVMGEVIIFALLALLLGFVITYMIPDIAPDEPVWLAMFWLLVQVIINAVFIYLIDSTYLHIFGFDSDTYIGLTVFTMLLLMTQVQIYNRTSYIYSLTTGTTINKAAPVMTS